MADGSVIIGVGLDTASFASSVTALESQLTSLGARLTQTFTGGYGLDTAAESMLVGVAEGIASMSSMVSTAVENTIQSAAAAFQGADWSGAGSGAASSLAAGIENGGGAVVSAAQSVADSAIQSFSGGEWSGIGYNIMSGIAEGIRSAGNSVVQAIRDVSEEAKAAVEAYYQISSPSALMRDEVGVMISRGMAEGILDGAGYIQSALNTVSAVSMPAYNVGERSGFSGRGGSITQNIYLRENDPSPYKTARAIRRESEAMLRI